MRLDICIDHLPEITAFVTGTKSLIVLESEDLIVPTYSATQLIHSWSWLCSVHWRDDDCHSCHSLRFFWIPKIVGLVILVHDFTSGSFHFHGSPPYWDKPHWPALQVRSLIFAEQSRRLRGSRVAGRIWKWGRLTQPVVFFYKKNIWWTSWDLGWWGAIFSEPTHWSNIQDASRLEAARCECEIQELLDCLGSSWFVLKIGYHDAPKSNGIIKWYTIIIYHTVVYHSHFPSQNRQGIPPFHTHLKPPGPKSRKATLQILGRKAEHRMDLRKFGDVFVCCLQSCFSPERSTMLIWSHLFSMGLFSFSGNRPWTPLDWRSTPCRRGWSLILAESPIWVHRLGGFLLDMVANRKVCARLQRFHQS